MSGFILGGELVWLGTGTAFGAMTAKRRGVLEWLIVGVVFGPLTLVALVAPRRRTPESAAQRPLIKVTRG
jgi:hypothetical protein